MTLNYLELQVLLDNCGRDDLGVLLNDVKQWEIRPTQVDTVSRRQKSEELYTALDAIPEDQEADNFENEIRMYLRSCAESRPHRSRVWPSLVGGAA